MAAQRDLANQLLELARDDEAAARTLFEADSVESVVGFHCQQAVEKALKAVLADGGLQFPFTHDIELLVQLSRTGRRSWVMSRLGSPGDPVGEGAQLDAVPSCPKPCPPN